MTQSTEKNLISNIAQKSASIADLTCGLCQTPGLPIFLIRKSIIPNDYNASIDWSKGMNLSELEGREPTEPLVHHKNVYRLLREGFVYIMLQRAGSTEKQFLTYESLEQGGFRFKPEREIEEKKPKELSERCVNKNHHIKALFLSIPNPENYDSVWIAYSRHAWSEQVKEYYKSVDVSKLSRFTHILINKSSMVDPALLVTKEMAPRAFNTEQFIDGERILFETHFKNSENKKLLYPFRALDPLDLQNELKLLNDQGLKAGTVIVEDTLGLAEELAFYRSQYVQPYLSAIRQADLNIENMITQEYQHNVDEGLAKEGTEFDSPLDLLIKAYNQYKEDKPCEAEQLYKKTDYWQKFLDTYGTAMQTSHDSPFIAGSIVQGQDVLQKEESFAACVVNNNNDASILDRYFSEDNVYKRKILSCIDSYKNALLQFYHETTKDTEKVVYTFRGGIYESTIVDNYFNNSIANKSAVPKYVLEQSLNQIEIFDIEKMELLELPPDIADKKLRQFNALYGETLLGRKSEATHVAVYRYKGTGSELAQKKFDKKWAEIEKRLDLKRYQEFSNDNIKLYNELMDKVLKLSKDYFTYLTWLAGNEPVDKTDETDHGAVTNNYAIQLNSYNDNYFWQIEYPVDYSDTHFNFMTDIIKVLKMDYLGTMTLDQQFGVWDRMFRNKKTLFFWPFYGDGKNDTLWTLLLSTHLKESEKLKDDQMLSMSDVIKQVADNAKSIIGIDLAKSKIKDFLGLYNGLNSLAIEGFSNIPAKGMFDLKNGKGFLSSLSNQATINTKPLINTNLTQVHLQGAFRLLSGLSAEVVQLKVSRSQLNQTLDLLIKNKILILSSDSAKNTITTTEGRTITFTMNEAKGRVDILETTGKGQFTLQAFLVGKNEEEIKKLATALSKGDFSVLSEMKDKISFSAVKGNNYHDIESYFNELVNKERATVYLENGISLALNGILAIFEVLNFMRNLESLNSLRLGEAERKEIYSSLSKSCVTGTQLAFEGIASSIAIITANASGKSALFFIKQSSVQIARGAGAILSIWVIADGIGGILKGVARASYGDVGGLGYVLGSSFQILSGVAALLSILFPIFGIVAFILGVISALLLWIFRDKSESWTLIEKWMTRCYFGNAEHQEKLTPYPLNNYGTFYAINDYFCALNGATATIWYDSNDNSLFVNSPRYDNTTDIGAIQSRGDYATLFNKSIYINLVLPNYDKNLSTFDGILYIEPDLTPGRRLAKADEQPIKVKFESSNRDNMLQITNKDDIPLSTFLVRQKLELDEEKGELYSYIKLKDSEEFSSSYGISIKLGELLGNHKLALVVKYWQEGKIKQDNHGRKQQQIPLLLTYHYKD
ncbi:toxin VasX [Orbus mooreae]|uniref:toxin VasX n=1 Tax=Orbus mooreae TaxID=3074107 RepID=UPI00370DD544